MILMPQIFDVTANENARYKRNELESKFWWRFVLSQGFFVMGLSQISSFILLLYFNIS